MKKFGRSTVTGMVHSWLTDTLDTPGENAQLEDADFTTTLSTPRVKLDNYIQIFMRDCTVTDSQEAVLKAGIKSELAYQMQKTLKAIAQDVEYAIVNNDTAVQGNSTTPGKFGGIPYFVNSTKTAPNVIAATGSLTENNLNDAIQAAWKQGGTPDICVVSGANKRLISGFTGNANRQRNADSTKVKQVVDVYESDFGMVNMLLHRMMPDKRIDLLQSEYWKLAYLIPFKTMEKPKNSLLSGKVVTGQLTLECRSPLANARIDIA
nr:MAG TPA: Major capsid protein [Caudoviricetes sp.]